MNISIISLKAPASWYKLSQLGCIWPHAAGCPAISGPGDNYVILHKHKKEESSSRFGSSVQSEHQGVGSKYPRFSGLLLLAAGWLPKT